MARKNGWVLIQDTAWPGYEDIPADIMRGYTTLAWEIERQRTERGWELPTHLFLQAGVGSFAGAMAGYFSALWRTELPKIIVVEPDQADCLYRTAKAADGNLRAVTGPMNSMMAGLCCGEPCTLGWEILRDRACGFISCDDETSALGMRLLGRPLGSDPAVVSGGVRCRDDGRRGQTDAGIRPERPAEYAEIGPNLPHPPRQHRRGHRPGKLSENPGYLKHLTPLFTQR